MTPTHAVPIFDGHNDTLLDLYRPGPGQERSFFAQSEHGHIDLPRARAGGFGGGFFAVFIPRESGAAPTDRLPDGGAYESPLPPPIELGYAQRVAMGMSGLLFRLEAESAGALKVVRSAAEIAACLESGTIAAILHFEGAEAIDPGLSRLRSSTRPACAPSALSGAGRTPSATACHSPTRARPTPAPA